MSNILKAKLDTGEIVDYDAAGFLEDTYDPSKFRCLGRGEVYDIHVLPIKQYFFKRICDEVADRKTS